MADDLKEKVETRLLEQMAELERWIWTEKDGPEGDGIELLVRARNAIAQAVHGIPTGERCRTCNELLRRHSGAGEKRSGPEPERERSRLYAVTVRRASGGGLFEMRQGTRAYTAADAIAQARLELDLETPGAIVPVAIIAKVEPDDG